MLVFVEKVMERNDKDYFAGAQVRQDSPSNRGGRTAPRPFPHPHIPWPFPRPRASHSPQPTVAD